MTRKIVVGYLVLLLGIFATRTTDAQETPNAWEVVEVKPKTEFRHVVETQSLLESERHKSRLAGPHMHSLGLAFGPQRLPAILNWYAITNPRPATNQMLRLTVGGQAIEITVQEAAFLVTPAQRIADGPPPDVPPQLNCFKAYKVSASRGLNLEVTVAGALGPETRTLGQPLYLCVPTAEWHHADEFLVQDATSYWLVFGSESSELDQRLSTLDQFGLHSLTAHRTDHVCLPAQRK